MTGASWRRVVSVWPKMLGAGCVAFMLAVGLAACTRGAGVHIDYLNFVRFGGIEYVTPYTVVVRAPTADNLGPVYGKVGFKLDGNVDDSNYQPKDGDASYLDVGTPVYTVRGYAPTFRLAAQFAGRLTFYEANSNPKAKTGADLLDIGGKVRSIGVNSEYDGKTELATISDPAQVARLVALVLAAPVDQQRQETAAASYCIAFHLIDGTAVARNYWAGSGQIVPGILTPPDFRAAVEQAVQRRRKSTAARQPLDGRRKHPTSVRQRGALTRVARGPRPERPSGHGPLRRSHLPRTGDPGSRAGRGRAAR